MKTKDFFGNSKPMLEKFEKPDDQAKPVDRMPLTLEEQLEEQSIAFPRVFEYTEY